MKVLMAVVGAIVLVGGGADAHDWYSDLRTSSGQPCCGGQDCRPMKQGEVMTTGDNLYLWAPLESRQTLGPEVGLNQSGSPDERDEKAKIAHGWIIVDPSAILPVHSPDGRIHACWWASLGVWGCVIMPVSD